MHGMPARKLGANFAFERELGIVHIAVDAPQGFSNSVPMVWAATHPRYALVRLHGHSAETWNIGGASAASERFNYDYGEAELARLVPEIERLASSVEFTHVILNNNMEDEGQRNALTLRAARRGACGIHSAAMTTLLAALVDAAWPCTPMGSGNRSSGAAGAPRSIRTFIAAENRPA
jgi:uncharacterized protein YecE (DUF72 family)